MHRFPLRRTPLHAGIFDLSHIGQFSLTGSVTALYAKELHVGVTPFEAGPGRVAARRLSPRKGV